MTPIAYPWTALGVLAVLLVYAYATRMVGAARGKYEVKVPDTSGPDGFMRAFRAHQNMLEGMVIFLPLIAIVAGLYGDAAGGIYAAIFAVGRFLYVRGYNIAAEKRVTGFMVSMIASLIALLASIAGVLIQLFL